MAEYGKEYMIYSAKEILALLHGIERNHALVTANFDNGKDAILTAILAVRKADNSIVLDYGVNPLLNRRMLESQKVIFVTTDGQIKVQFSATDVVKTRFEKQDAFKIKIPTSLIRLQRREYYRIDTPVMQPPQCMVPIQNARRSKDADAKSNSEWSVRIVNISVGGVGIEDFPKAVAVIHNIVFKGCQIILPDIGTLTVNIKVLNTYDVAARAGGAVQRHGCIFINLDSGMQSMIQRYIIKLDREKIKQMEQLA